MGACVRLGWMLMTWKRLWRRSALGRSGCLHGDMSSGPGVREDPTGAQQGGPAEVSGNRPPGAKCTGRAARARPRDAAAAKKHKFHGCFSLLSMGIWVCLGICFLMTSSPGLLAKQTPSAPAPTRPVNRLLRLAPGGGVPGPRAPALPGPRGAREGRDGWC